MAAILLIGGLSRLALVSAARPQPKQAAIHEIQGAGSTSPLAGQMVGVEGIVTGVKANGFFIQTPDAQADNDPRTSEGIFIFTSQPPSVAERQRVNVTGTVLEFRPSSTPFALTLTEITSPTVTLVSAGNPLPAERTLSPADTDPSGPVDQLERFEGMRVRVDQLVAVSPTEGAVTERDATSVSTGVFYGVIGGYARPFREPGLDALDPLPVGSPCCVPRFDGNPERLRIDSRSMVTGISTQLIDAATGMTLTGIAGVMDYAQSSYTILFNQARPAIPPLPAAAPVSAPTSDQFTVASFNMERFFDTTDDPSKSDVVLTQAAFDLRLGKASLAIRNILRSPDIIGVEEVENLPALQAIAARINSDAAAAGGPAPNYQAFLAEGNDPGGIDSGFLVKTARVAVVEAVQFGRDATFIDPNNNQPATLNDRPPLLLRATIPQPGGAPFAITVIVNHLRSLLGIDDPASGPRTRAKRRAQAEFLANLIQARQSADPAERIISVGDYNSFQFSDGYVDLIGTIRGAPTPANQVVLASPDLVNPDLVNLTDLTSAERGHSYSFEGSAQTLDHILISSTLTRHLSRLEVARCNADFPDVLRGNGGRPERISDHDIPVGYFNLTPVPAPLTSVSAASFRIQGLAAEAIIAGFGAGFSSSTEAAAALPLPVTLAGVSVNIRDRFDVERAAPLLFVSPNQINFLVPAGLSPGTAAVAIARNNATAFAGSVTIETVAPGIFTANATGAGVPAANLLRIRADGSQAFEPVSRFDPAANQFVPLPIDLGPESEQVFLILFGTGWRSRANLSAVTLRMSGIDSEVVFAGAQGSLAGLDQINARIPRGLLGRGEIDLLLTVDGRAANRVRLHIR
ncbi:MAG: endonuclease/exonuclease/phosphatase family protein [Blastocatellia bacterium]